MSKLFKRVVFIFFISLVTTYAQNQDPEAKLLLRDVKSKINSYKNIRISFKYSLENKEENISQETEGKVTLKENMYTLEILGIKRIFDGYNLYSISYEDEEVTISNYENDEENTISPNNMLSFFNQGYNYTLDIEQNKSGLLIQYIKFTPIDSKSEIKYILLGIEKRTKHIHNLIEIGKNNTKTTLLVTNFDYNLPLKNSYFSFNISEYSNFYINKID